MTITVCLGSACHVKGSHFVLEGLKSLIKQHHVEDKVTLAGTFCTGNCQKGVCVTIGLCMSSLRGRTIGDTLYSLSPETTADFFEKEVLAKL